MAKKKKQNNTQQNNFISIDDILNNMMSSGSLIGYSEYKGKQTEHQGIVDDNISQKQNIIVSKALEERVPSAKNQNKNDAFLLNKKPILNLTNNDDNDEDRIVSKALEEKGMGWRIVWSISVFDLPTKTRRERKSYAKYRKALLSDGYMMFQYSVYLKHFPTYNQARAEADRLGEFVPDNGKVSFFFLTDKQYGATKSYYGKKDASKDMPQYEEQSIFLYLDEDGDDLPDFSWLNSSNQSSDNDEDLTDFL